MSLFKKAVLTMACLTLFTIGAHASASAVYIAQNAAGAANGADCADAKPVSFFNTAGQLGLRNGPNRPRHHGASVRHDCRSCE